MKIVLVAYDAGPSEALSLIAEELRCSGHSVFPFLARGTRFLQGVSSEMPNAVSKADCVLTGISSSKERSRYEIVAIQEARKKNVPNGFFCFNYGEFNRPWLKKEIATAQFIFTVDEKEAQAARNLAPQATVIASGNPSWETYFKPKFTRDEVRNNLGINDSEKLILSGGSKEAFRNILLWGTLLGAANELGDPAIYIALSTHPGDNINNRALYEDLVAHSGVSVRFLDDINTNDALIGADLLVTSISSVGIAAACQRVPVIDFISHFDKKWWKNLSGSEDWKPVEYGASWSVHSTEKMVLVMQSLLKSQPSIQSVRMSQEAHYPIPASKGAARIIADAICA